ncbi:hypothetical protein GCM10028822_00530 [Hymenobacter terrigena]
MRQKLLLLLLLLLAAWGARAQAPTWQSALSSAAVDVRDVAITASGDVYVTGSFTGSVTFGPNTLNSTGDTDMFVAKWASGASTWAWGASGGGGTAGTGGTAEDLGNAIAVNGNRVYVTGVYRATQFTTGSGTTLTNNGGWDMFVAKFTDNTTSVTASGLQGSTAGASQEYAYGMAVNPANGNVYVTGYFGSSSLPNATISGTALTSSGSADVYVAKFLDNGTTFSNGGAVRAGGASGEIATCLALNGNNIYIGGRFNSSGTAVIGSSTLTNGGANDIFVARFTDTTPTATGGITANYAQKGGGDGSDGAQGIAVNTTTGSIYVMGTINTSSVGISVAGTALTTSAGSQDIFVAKYTDSGAALVNGYAIADGGANAEDAIDGSIGGDIAVNGSFVYVTTDYSASTSIAGTTLTSAGGYDAFVAKYTDTGSTFAGNGALSGGGSGDDTGFGLAVNGTQGVVGGKMVPTANFGTSLTSGNAYAARVSFAAAPTVTTTTAGSVTTAAAVLGGNVTADGGDAVTGRGVVYSTTNATPTVGGSGTTTAPNGTGTGSFSATISGLSAGTRYYVVAYATNSVGTSYGSVLQFVTTPNAPVVTTPANGSIVATTTPTYTGTAQANSTVTVSVDGAALSGTVTADASGNWSKAQPTALSQGSHTVYATTVVTVGGTSSSASANSNTNTFIVDTVPPAAPVVTTPANGSAVATTIPTYSGTAEANSTVTVIVDAASIGTTTANASGNWSLAQPTALSQGSHTVRATARDAAGNNSSSSSTNTFTVDTVAPTVTISSTAGSNGSTTPTTPVPFTVTFSESVTGFVQGDLTVTNGTVSGFAGSGTTYTFSVTPTGSGTTVTVNVPASVAQDAAGNFNTAASQFSITYQQPVVAVAQNVTVNLDASGNATLNASSVNNGSTGGGTLTYTIQKIVYGRVAEGNTLTMTTPSGVNFTAIRFASYGTPTNDANGNYRLGSCNAANSVITAQNSYVGRSTGSMDANNAATANNNPTLGDPCAGTPKALAVQAAYSADAASLTYNCSEANKTQYVLLTVTDGSGSTSTSVAQVTVNPPATATISSVSPTTAQRGATVTVAGTNLSGVNSVTVNGATATVSGLSASGFTFVVPTGATFGPGTLTVTAPCGQTLTSAFTVQAVITVSPASLPNGTQGTAYSQALTASGGTAPYSYAITAGALPAGLTLTNGTIAGTPTTNGTFTFTVTATDASAAPGPYSGSRTYTLTIAPPPTVTVVSVTRLTPSPTATATVSYQVTFSGSVTGLTTTNFDLTTTGLSSAAVTSVSGSGTTYTVVVNTGTGSGTLTLNVANTTGVSPTISNVPYTSGQQYTITKSFAAAPTLRIQAAGSASGNSDVTAFVDMVQVLSGGTAFANGLQNGSFESNNVPAGSYLYQSDGVVATPWTFGPQAGVSRNGSAFGSTAADGDAVALLQSAAGNNGNVLQNLAVPTGSYQVSFRAIQRNYTSLDQRLNVYVNDVFVGNIQPNNTPTYNTFTSASFNVTASALTATVSTTSASPTSTSPIPFSVSFSPLSVGTTFTASDVTVTGGTLTSGSFSGSGAGPYTFTVTPSGFGTVSVSLAANVAQDANNTGNSASNTVSVQFVAPTITVAPTTLPAGTVGAAYSQTLTASGGTAPYSYAITAGALPAGLTLTNGTIAGTPTTSGSFTFTVTATDASSAPGPYSGSRSYTLTITAPTITVAPATLPGGTQGTAYSQTITASGGTAPYSYAITAGALPTGLTLSTGGVLAGTPTGNGTSNFTVTATDAFGSTGAQAYTLVIATPALVTWTGNVSTDWFTANNWSPITVPTSTIDATIPTAPSGNRFPAILAGTASVRNLTLNSGAALTQAGGTLDVRADLTNNGTYQPTGGTVVLGTSTQANILGSSNTRFWNLTVGANGAQSSTSASTSVQRLFTLNGNFTTNGNPFTLESNANLTALVVNNGSNVIVGNATVQRYIAPDLNPGLGYRHYSAPVSTATVGSLTTSTFTPVVNPAYNTSAAPNSVRPFPTVYYYDQARLATSTNSLAPFDKGWTSPSALTDPLNVGQGYTVNLAANQTLSVNGPQNNGNISLALGRNSGATATDAGWQLVGNPYPSPLDYSLVGAADRNNLDAAMYVFESTSLYGGTYRANVNGVGGNANSPNSILAQGQGFFVRVSNGQTSGNLTLRNSHRVTAYQNPVYHRTTETRPLVQLDLQSATGSDPLYVYFEQAATAGTDSEYDAVKLPNSTGLNLAAWAGSDKLAINALPLTSTTSVTVPLFIGLPVTGTYTLHAAQVLNFGAGEQPFLRDLQLGTLTDLSLHPDYTFTMNAANTTPRFELVFGARVLGVASAKLAAQVAVYPNPASKAVFVELPSVLNRKAVTAALVDALGRVVLTQALPAGQPTYTLPLTNLATGVYSLRLQTEAGVVVKKLVVE